MVRSLSTPPDNLMFTPVAGGEPLRVIAVGVTYSGGTRFLLAVPDQPPRWVPAADGRLFFASR